MNFSETSLSGTVAAGNDQLRAPEIARQVTEASQDQEEPHDVSS